VKEKFAVRERELNADIQSNLKQMQAYDKELSTQSEKYALLNKQK